ncbi:MAG: hypothetical protein U0840_11365 [Gemmataceae bacterium]
MPEPSQLLVRSRGITSLKVVLCCLLTLASTLNLTILFDLLSQNLPHAQLRAHFSEMGEEIDEETHMHHSSGDRAVQRRCSLPRPFDVLLECRVTSRLTGWLLRLPPGIPARTGSEHSFRNGLGVPLRC